jgi:transposase
MQFLSFFIIALTVANASATDRAGAAALLSRIVGVCQRFAVIWADGGYRCRLRDWVKEHFSWTLDIVLRSEKSKEFIALPKGWIVESANAWLGESLDDLTGGVRSYLKRAKPLSILP